MNDKADPTITSPVERRIRELKSVPQRDPLRAASGRARFLREAAEYRKTVSSEVDERRKRWIFPIQKEKLSMNALVMLILAASLLLGGGATVAAAQDDLPNQSLYQLKLWTENATLAMNGDPQEQATLLMTLTKTRVQEMAALVEMGVAPPDRVRERLQQHLDQAMILAAGMEEGTRVKYLQQLHDQLQSNDQIMQQAQLHAAPESEPQLIRTREMLQHNLQLANKGRANPQGFQHMLENQIRHGQDDEQSAESNQQGEPGFHQKGEKGNPSGNRNPNGGDGNKPKNGNGPGNSEHEPPGGPNNSNSPGGENGQGGNGPGGGGNK